MDNETIKNLEYNVNRTIQAISGLRDEKNKLEKENVSLRRQNEELQRQVEELRLNLSTRPESLSNLPQDFDIQAVKARLEKLAAKLAALDDTWN
jgi:regulator of replication initiation timing